MAGGAHTFSSQLIPFLIEPQFMTKVWGFHDLRPWYDYVAGDESRSAGARSNSGDPIGEVWLTGDDCRIASGPDIGKTLGEFFSSAPAGLIGADAPSSQSPLLVKIIFAHEKLSVQVHPDDRMAHKYGLPRGKTECWYALAADPGAQVALGLKPGVTLDEVRAGIDHGTLEKSLNAVSVARGDMVFVDAGTVHAVWPGSILLETQQYSDTTYRMYDYGRPRELHVDKSIEATRLQTRAGLVPPRVLDDRTILIDVEYFRVERISVNGNRASDTLPGPGESHPTLSYLFTAAGSARLTGSGFDPLHVPARRMVAVPAVSPAFTMEDLGGLDLIRISPRWPKKEA
jgi:mannose-6-phosphate isomerase